MARSEAEIVMIKESCSEILFCRRTYALRSRVMASLGCGASG